MSIKLAELFDDATKQGKSAASSPPRNFDQMTSAGSADADALKKKVDLSNRVFPRVDYSDFSNFVFFNSALDYFNISGERMLNEYPYDGTLDDVLGFQSQSDGYQNYLLSTWPKTSGCLSFPSASQIPYVSIDDELSKINLSGSEYTIELHIDKQPDMQSGSGFTYLQLLDVSGSEVLTVYNDSGTIQTYTQEAQDNYGTHPNDADYIALVCFADRHYAYAANLTSSVYQFHSGTSGAAVTSKSKTLTIGSGTLGLAGLVTIPGDVKIREVRIWNVAKTQVELQANYNTRVFKSPDLLYYGRFTDGFGSIAKDYSGNKLNGIIQGAVWDQSEQLLMSKQDNWDYILNFKHPSITTFVNVNQTAAALFDRNNVGVITRLVPEQFLILEDENNARVLKDLLYLLARQFDELKVAIDQFPKILTVNNTGFNDSPDALLEDALKFWGWDPKGSFLSKEAFQYFFGINVITGDQADYDNQRLDATLADVKNKFWRRTLQNLPYIYKRKGTLESVNALLRVYGLDEKSVKLKEFGLKPEVRIQTSRINSERSVFPSEFSAFGSASSIGTVGPVYGMLSTNVNVCFPTSSTTGTLLGLANSHNLTYSTASSGTFTIAGATFTGVNVFDNRWYNLCLQTNYTTATLYVSHLDEDYIDWSYSSSSLMSSSIIGSNKFTMGPGVFKATNAQVWGLEQSEQEREDHAINPFSYGSMTPDRNDLLFIHWYLEKDVVDVNYTGSVISAVTASLLEYNFIAPPEYGWNEDKIRSFSSTTTPKGEVWSDNTKLSLEFNLIDALNEDISYMMSSLDNWNNIIGDAANRYRDTYPQLEKLKRQYFNRLTGRINFRAFADFLDFFDRSFVDMVAKLLPAEANFTGAEFVVESHMLERPKVQYHYRRHDVQLIPEGRIVIYAPQPSSWTHNNTSISGSPGFQYGLDVTF